MNLQLLLKQYLGIIIAVFLVVTEKHSIVTVGKFELRYPQFPILVPISLDGHTSHLRPVHKIHLKPLLRAICVGYPASFLVKPTLTRWIVTMLAWSRYWRIRDLIIFQSKACHAWRRLSSRKTWLEKFSVFIFFFVSELNKAQRLQLKNEIAITYYKYLLVNFFYVAVDLAVI